MTTTKQMDRMIERQEYINNANVDLSYLHKGLAVVISESDPEKEYCVEVLDGVAASCGCDDWHWRSKKNAAHVCKHMEAVNNALSASLPMIGTEEAKEIAADMVKIFKPARRSAVRHDVVAALQVAEGTKVGIAQVRKAFAKSNNVHSVPTTCTVNVLDKAA